GADRERAVRASGITVGGTQSPLADPALDDRRPRVGADSFQRRYGMHALHCGGRPRVRRRGEQHDDGWYTRTATRRSPDMSVNRKDDQHNEDLVREIADSFNASMRSRYATEDATDSADAEAAGAEAAQESQHRLVITGDQRNSGRNRRRR